MFREMRRIFPLPQRYTSNSSAQTGTRAEKKAKETSCKVLSEIKLKTSSLKLADVSFACICFKISNFQQHGPEFVERRVELYL